MARSAVAAAALAALLAGVAEACPPIDEFRSAFVKTQLDVQSLNGLWYEMAYQDLAQIGASCQLMNKTAVSGGILEDYRVQYGTLPFNLPLFYNATFQSPNGTWTQEAGVYRRYLQGLPLASFPSVIVDVDVDSDGSYKALTEYLCWDVLGLDYVEVRVSTRDPAAPLSYIQEMEDRARAIGLTWQGNLTYVNHTGCQPFGAPAVTVAELPAGHAAAAAAAAAAASGAATA